MAQFETVIQCQLEEFRKEASFVTQERVLHKITSDCKLTKVLLGEEFDKYCAISPQQKNVQCKEACIKQVMSLQNKEIEADIMAKQKAKCRSEARTGIVEETGCGDCIVIGIPKSLPVCFDAKRNQIVELPDCYNYGHIDPKTPRSSEIFFQAPQNHEPFKFEYDKIFGLQSQNISQKRHIERLFLEALGVDVEKLNELQENQLDLKMATCECIEQTLRKFKPVEAVGDNDAWPLVQYPKYGKYDPNDTELMEKMLRDAFDYMKNNPKFVWAQLPDAYKLPMLREWMWQRYGKVYTPRDRYKSYAKSAQIFKALDKSAIAVKQPTLKDLGKQELVDYNCRSYVEKKVKIIHRKYFNRLSDAMLERSRILWYAMRPYLCAGGPPRHTYFAYMPSRFGDIQHSCIWKSTEFRDNRAAWVERQMKKNQHN